MSMLRRDLLAGGGAFALIQSPVSAVSYPIKPIRLIVGFVPGGSTDFTARVLAEALTARLGQTVLVENRPGAVAAIAMDYVAKSPPDGYTLAFTSSETTMLSAVKHNLPYEISRDFSFISRVVQLDYVLTVSAKLPVKSVAELVAYAKANPGKVRYGSNGIGSSNHLMMLLISQQAGIQMVNVPYKGGAANQTDLVGGFIDLALLTVTTTKDYVNSDKIRLLAVTGSRREPSLPDVPTLAEAGYPGATHLQWLGVWGPAKLPKEVQDRLGTAIADAMKDPAVTKKLLNLSLNPSPIAGDAFRKAAVGETREWGELAAKEHISVE